MRHLLILGRGFVGSAVERAALSDPHIERVSVIDPPFDPQLRHRDAAATSRLRSLVEEGSVDALINACGRVAGSDDELFDANELFVSWLCDAISELDVRMVHIGSASEYGDPGSASPLDESSPPKPSGAYASSKAAGTRAVLDAIASGLNGTVARVFNIVANPIPAVSPIHQWLTDLSSVPPSGGEVVVWWPPTTRDFLRLDDVAEALLDLCRSEDPPPLVNVCSGVPLRYGDIVSELADQLGINATIRSLDRAGIESVVGDPTLLHHAIGWTPPMSLRLLATTALGSDGAESVSG